MKKQIRKSAFETNSSSTHSICITKNNILDQKQKHVDFTIGEFGWEREQYHDPYSKAQYLYTAILVNSRGDLLSNIKIILIKNNINYNFEIPQYNSSGDYTWLDNGYIDHDEDLDEFLSICKDENKLMKYLFSSESFIITGNDNDDYDVDINVDYDHDEYYKGN